MLDIAHTSPSRFYNDDDDHCYAYESLLFTGCSSHVVVFRVMTKTSLVGGFISEDSSIQICYAV